MKSAQLARSVYYYQTKSAGQKDKYRTLKSQITKIYHDHKGRYGYRRIYLTLRNQGEIINHKTVYRLMKDLKLKSIVRPKRYSSYKGTCGVLSPNRLERDFYSERPNTKWVTDVTEFKVNGKKVYLSPLMDLFNGEILSYGINENPNNFKSVMKMLKGGLKQLGKLDRPVLHSDQGWQYQMQGFRRFLEDNQIVQSMSRKGNCLDNAAMESFFAVLKTEFFHRQHFESVAVFIEELKAYIHYYNHERIKQKLKGLSPVQYRTQAFG